MKQFYILMIGASLLALILPSTAMAAKADGKKAKLIAKYDKNSNGILDADEMDALRKDFEADTNGDLKVYDTDGDGKLSDDEIKAIKPGASKKPKTEDGSEKAKKGKKSKKGKSEDSATSKKTGGEGEPSEDKAAKSSE